MKFSNILILGSLNGFIISVISQLNYPFKTFIYDTNPKSINKAIDGMMKDNWLQYLYKKNYIVFLTSLSSDEYFKYCILQQNCEDLYSSYVHNVLGDGSLLIIPCIDKKTQNYNSLKVYKMDKHGDLKETNDILKFWN